MSLYSTENPGNEIYRVQFQHGTPQIGFFNKVVHVMKDWECQQCGIQLKYFIWFGCIHYDKYGIRDSPQGSFLIK